MNLEQKRAAKCAEQRAIIDRIRAEARAMTAEEETQFNALQTEIEGLDRAIAAMASVDTRDAADNTPVNSPIYTSPRDLDKPWASFGEQLMAVANAGKPGGPVDNRLLAPFKAASGANEQINSEGGFLVGETFVAELLKNTYETAVVASKCRKIPIGPGSNSLRMNGVDESSRVDGSRYGGVQAYWTGEAATVTASKPKFREVTLKLEKLMALYYATDELMADATALEAIASDVFASEMGFKLDDALINGLGAGMPLGIMASPALVTVAKEGGQLADTIVPENIMKMWARMWAKSRANSVWFINQDCEPQLHGMSLAVGAGGVPVYMPANGLSGLPYSTLYGRPVLPIEQCQTLGDKGDIILADMSQYLLIDKGGIAAAQSVHVRFLYDENVFRFTYRVNGAPSWISALTPFKGSNTLSPFVTLAERA